MTRSPVPSACMRMAVSDRSKTTASLGKLFGGGILAAVWPTVKAGESKSKKDKAVHVPTDIPQTPYARKQNCEELPRAR